MSDRARTGKIARCPSAVREELNHRLLNGEPASKILPWLNGLEDVLKILDLYFHEEPISPQNLSEWRKGKDGKPSGYEEWLNRRANISRIKELSDYSLQLAKAAGGNVTDGAAAIMAGRILEAIETSAAEDDQPAEKSYELKDGETPEDQEKEPKLNIAGLTDCLVALRRTDLDARKVIQRERMLDQKERQVALAEKQFQVRTCELFLKYYADKKVQDIVEGKARKDVKVEQLRFQIFGAKPTEGEE